MATDDDDDVLTGPVPPPDAEPTAAERAHARTFAELVDKTLAGRTPPAMSADNRALLEVATVIRAASGKLPLAEDRQRAVVEEALRQAIGGGGGSPAASVAPVTSLRRRGARTWAPWAIAAGSTLVAAAAIVALWLRAPAPVPAPAPTATAALPTTWQSRPADALIGPIPHERAGDAEARIDAIFADRLDGFREDSVYRGRGRTP